MTAPPPLTAHPGPDTDWAIFLDVDGTLLEIAPTPEAVAVAPGLVPILERLRKACGGALALISGRPIAQLDRLFSPFHGPAAGLHGLERRLSDSRLFRPSGENEGLETIRRRLAAFAAGRPGVRLEDKSLSLALHFREAPEAEADVLRAVAETLSSAGLGETFHAIEGKMVVEVKPKGMDKGRAVALFLTEPPFVGRRPIYVGDDITDEDGFRAVNELGGLTVLVGDRPSAAHWSLPTVAALHRWLRETADRLERAAGPDRETGR